MSISQEDRYSQFPTWKGMDWRDLPAFFGPKELASSFGIEMTKAYQLFKSAEFPVIRIGRNIRISRDG